MWNQWLLDGKGREECISTVEKNFRTIKLFCMILEWWYSNTCLCTLVKITEGRKQWTLIWNILVFVHLLSHARLFVTPKDCGMSGFPVLHCLWILLKSCPLSCWCHPTIYPLSSPSLPVFNLSQHQGLSQWVSSSHQVAKVLESQLQHQSFQWIFRVDLFRMDWLDLLAVHGTLTSVLQHHSLKVPILQCSTFFMVSHICIWPLEKP